MTARLPQKDSRPLIPPDVFTNLWNQHSATLQLIARSRCSNPEDCVQEAFVRLSKQSQLPNDPMAWLVRVTRNEAITKWRSENRRKSHEKKHASERTPWFIVKSGADDPTNPDELQNALIQLEPDCREIVIAHIWGRLSFRQIAEAFDISNSTAHRQYLAGIERLKELLGART